MKLPEEVQRFSPKKLVARSERTAVLSGTHPLTQQAVAIKLVRWKGASESAEAEFRALGECLVSLRQPAVPRVFASGVAPAVAGYLVHEWLECEPLPDRLDRPEVLRGALGVVEGLRALASRGESHRSVRPDNLLAAEGRVVLSGWGTGYVFDPSDSYAAPERGRAIARRSHWRADLYSFALTLCEMLGLRVAAGRGGSDPVIEELSASSYFYGGEGLRLVLQSCLAQEPSRRPVSWDVVERALRECVMDPQEDSQLVTTDSGRVSGSSPLVYTAPLGESDEEVEAPRRAREEPPPPSIADTVRTVRLDPGAVEGFLKAEREQLHRESGEESPETVAAAPAPPSPEEAVLPDPPPEIEEETGEIEPAASTAAHEPRPEDRISSWLGPHLTIDPTPPPTPRDEIEEEERSRLRPSSRSIPAAAFMDTDVIEAQREESRRRWRSPVSVFSALLLFVAALLVFAALVWLSTVPDSGEAVAAGSGSVEAPEEASPRSAGSTPTALARPASPRIDADRLRADSVPPRIRGRSLTARRGAAGEVWLELAAADDLVLHRVELFARSGGASAFERFEANATEGEQFRVVLEAVQPGTPVALYARAIDARGNVGWLGSESDPVELRLP